MALQQQPMSEIEAISLIDKILNMARAQRDDMAMSHLQAFLMIAKADKDGSPLNGSDVRKHLDLSTTQAYRVVWNLGSEEVRDRGSKKQMGLIETIPDPAHRNSKLLVMTPKGKAFFKAMIEAVSTHGQL